MTCTYIFFVALKNMIMDMVLKTKIKCSNNNQLN